MKLISLFMGFLGSFLAFSQTAGTYISPLSRAKTIAEAQINSTPYKKEQHEAFLNYFYKFGEFIDDVNGSESIQDRFQSYVATEGVSTLCKKFLLSEDDWKTLMGRCTKNRFFLCADEIKEYGLYKQSLKRLLTAEQQDTFSKISHCH